MSAVSRYAYLHARVSVLTQYLFQEEALQALIEGSSSGDTLLQRIGLANPLLEEVASPSSNPFPQGGKGYGAILEQRLIDLFLADVETLVRPIGGAARDLLIYWVRRYELGNLKAIIRGKMVGQTQAWIRDELINVSPFATLPVEDLLQTEDATEMLRRLEATPYKDIARQARAIFEERNELFALDAVVDKRYYSGLHQRVRVLPATDQQHLCPLIGILLDRINLIWLLRYRFVYDLAPAHTYYLLIPTGAYLSSNQLLALVQLGTPEEVIRNIPPALAAIVGESTVPTEVEDLLVREIRRRAEIVLKRTTFSVARAFAYLVMREHQLYQIHAVLKGKQLGLGEGLIRSAAQLGPAIGVIQKLTVNTK
ncbi:V/A-type H+/Na+-transporting ATPase subunit C [Gammaproteobacteria bacterium]